ncbi:MAG TPA: UbiA family prenyltransferase [Polyangiaceae bacterium]|nr:UbiA family prenyltransferase [Polyangiaceae bacterium]
MTDSARTKPSTWRVLLNLGRISNLPTVWTNVWAGAALSGAHPSVAALIECMIALSLLYVGGMFLNDAFDRHIDKEQRPERPIPSGQISATAVFGIGFALLAGGTLTATLTASLVTAGSLIGSLVSAAALCGAIVAYNVRHKGNAVAPFIMGLCRALVYTTSALTLGGRLTPALLVGGLGLLLYVVGLTFVARGENKGVLESPSALAFLFAPTLAFAWLAQQQSGEAFLLSGALWLIWLSYCLRPLLRGQSSVMRAVVQLIAGVSLVDAALAGVLAGPWSLAVGALGTGCTLFLQRAVRGT